jgi:gelsolin
MTFTVEAEGKVTRDNLDSKDVFVLDAGPEVFVWVGKDASVKEKAHAMGYAQTYLKKNDRPNWLPLTRVFDGGENQVFTAYLD